jgi:chromosome partitioning protein
MRIAIHDCELETNPNITYNFKKNKLRGKTMQKTSFYNNKGGAGKSTTVINLAYILASLGRKILVVDCDEQQNTFRFFVDTDDKNGFETCERYENIDIIKYSNYKENKDFDFEIFDLPPALNNYTIEIISLTDFVFVPIVLSSFSLQGLSRVTDFISGSNARFGGCFGSQFNKKNPYDLQMDKVISDKLGSKYLTTKIPLSNVIKNSLNFKQTAVEYMKCDARTPLKKGDKRIRSVVALGDFAAEFLERIEE